MRQLTVNNATYKRIAAYASRTGTTVSAAANEAINTWMEHNGEPILRGMERRRAERCRNLIVLPKSARRIETRQSSSAVRLALIPNLNGGKQE